MKVYHLKHREVRCWYRRYSHKSILVVTEGGPIKVRWHKNGLHEAMDLHHGQMFEVPARAWYGYEALRPAEVSESCGCVDAEPMPEAEHEEERVRGVLWPPL